MHLIGRTPTCAALRTGRLPAPVIPAAQRVSRPDHRADAEADGVAVELGQELGRPPLSGLEADLSLARDVQRELLAR